MIPVSTASAACFSTAPHYKYIELLRFRAKGVKKHTLHTVDTVGQVPVHAAPRRSSNCGRAHFKPTRSCRGAVCRHWASHSQVRHRYFPTCCSPVGPWGQPRILIGFVALSGPVSCVRRGRDGQVGRPRGAPRWPAAQRAPPGRTGLRLPPPRWPRVAFLGVWGPTPGPRTARSTMKRRSQDEH